MVIYRFKDGLSTLGESFQENLCDITDKSLFKNELLSYFDISIEEDLINSSQWYLFWMHLQHLEAVDKDCIVEDGEDEEVDWCQ